MLCEAWFGQPISLFILRRGRRLFRLSAFRARPLERQHIQRREWEGGSYPDIGGDAKASGSGIAVNAYKPCVPIGSPTFHCDLVSNDPGASINDVLARRVCAPTRQGRSLCNGRLCLDATQ